MQNPPQEDKKQKNQNQGCHDSLLHNLLEVNITSYQEQSSNDEESQYLIKVKYNNDQEWEVSRSFLNFQELHHKLAKTYCQCPILPPRAVLKLNQDEKAIRMRALNKYLLQCLRARNIFISTTFREFIDIESSMSIYGNPPSLLRYITNSDFKIIKSLVIDKRGLVIQVTCKPFEKKSIKSMMSNWVGSFWGARSVNNDTSNQNENGEQELKGKVNVLQESHLKNYDLRLKSVINLYEHPTSATYIRSTKMLIIGFLDGKITCYTLTAEDNYSKFVEYTSFKEYNSSVIGLCQAPIQAQVIALGEDRTIVSVDISNSKNYKLDEHQFNCDITCIYYDSMDERIYLGTEKGEFFIYRFDVHFLMVGKIETGIESKMTYFLIEKSRKYFFLGYDMGYVSVYQLKGPGKELEMHQINCYEIEGEITAVDFMHKKTILLVSNDLGTVYFIDVKTSDITSVLYAHDESIHSLMAMRDDGYLLTASDSKDTKIWVVPEHFYSREFPKSRELDVGISKAHRLEESDDHDRESKDENDQNGDQKGNENKEKKPKRFKKVKIFKPNGDSDSESDYEDEEYSEDSSSDSSVADKIPPKEEKEVIKEQEEELEQDSEQLGLDSSSDEFIYQSKSKSDKVQQDRVKIDPLNSIKKEPKQAILGDIDTDEEEEEDKTKQINKKAFNGKSDSSESEDKTFKMKKQVKKKFGDPNDDSDSDDSLGGWQN